MKIAIHAGHNPAGKVACGAVGLLNESVCNREIVAELVPMLRAAGHDVFNSTVDDGKNQSDVLAKICKLTNTFDPDISISIHLNAHTSPEANGVEAYYWAGDEEMHTLCDNIITELSKMGYAKRRSTPTKSLKVINSIKAHSILIECGFVTNSYDSKLYNAHDIARRISNAIITKYGGTVMQPSPPVDKVENNVGYSLQLGYFINRENCERLADEIRAKGYDCIIKEVKK